MAGYSASTGVIKYDRVDLKKWNVFSAVPSSTLNDVVLAHICGCEAESAFFVNSKDEVYAIGANVLGRLGIGDISSTDSPVLMETLCGRNVKSFASGNVHALALTASGTVYSWGSNSYGQLGIGSNRSEDHPKVIEALFGIEIVQIGCANRYSLALTNQQEVFHWGDIGFLSEYEQNLPVLVELPDGLTVSSISCGGFHVAALTDCGKVMTWGVNDCGQLGLGHLETKDTPTIVGGQLADQTVTSVACGTACTLVLTVEGVLYAWGLNRESSLGLGHSSQFVVYPQRVLHRKNVVKIAASNLQSVFCFIAENPPEIYRWCYDDEENTPQVVPNCPNIIEAFYGLSLPVLERTDCLCRERMLQGPIRDIGKALFDIKDHSDLKIRLSDGIVYVHTLIMRAFSDHFRTILDGPWANGDDIIDMTRYNPKAYRAFLKYIYTGAITYMEGEEIIALYDIAVSYFEYELKLLCMEMFVNCITCSNLSRLYNLASSSQCSELANLCVQFCSQHLDEIILSEGFEKLESYLAKSLVSSAIKYKHTLK